VDGLNSEGQSSPREEIVARSQETLRAVARTLESLGTGDLTFGGMPEDTARPAAPNEIRPVPNSGPAPSLDSGPSVEMEFAQEEFPNAILLAEVSRLHHIRSTLREVSSRSELVTTEMLIGLDRSLLLLKELKQAQRAVAGPEVVKEDPSEGALRSTTGEEAHDPNSGLHHEDRLNRLEGELHRLVRHLRSENVSSHRIGEVATVIAGIEERLLRTAEMDR
jgi:hypothetical protein